MFVTPMLALMASVLGLWSLPDITVTAPQEVFPAIYKVPDRKLAIMRGGLRLPDGLDIGIGIDIQTRVNGALILHTIYSSDGPNAGIKVYTDGTSAASTAPTTVNVTAPATASAPTIIVDRAPTGTTVSAQTQSVPVNLNLVQGTPSTWLDGSGQNMVAVTPNGPAVSSEGNAIKLTTDSQSAAVTLDGPGLEIQHLVGQATGIVVANTGNDRVIDTVSSINVNLQGISPVLMSSFFTANRIATDAMQARGL